MDMDRRRSVGLGQRGYFFLQKDVPGKFGVLGSQARIWIEDGRLHSGGDHDLKAVRRVHGLAPGPADDGTASLGARSPRGIR